MKTHLKRHGHRGFHGRWKASWRIFPLVLRRTHSWLWYRLDRLSSSGVLSCPTAGTVSTRPKSRKISNNRKWYWSFFQIVKFKSNWGRQIARQIHLTIMNFAHTQLPRWEMKWHFFFCVFCSRFSSLLSVFVASRKNINRLRNIAKNVFVKKRILTNFVAFPNEIRRNVLLS